MARLREPAPPDTVPGVVVNHTPAARQQYNGCPSIAVLPDGDYVASHSLFGPGATNTDSFVYRSGDRGQSWRRIAEVHGQIWSKLFVHRGDLYLIGTDHCDRYGGRLNGRMVIRRSTDGGATWSDARGAGSGLLSDEDGYHTAAVALVEHDGRLWKAMEFAPEPDRKTWQAFVISAPVDADLLDRANWTFSERLSHRWSGNQWIEGNVVVAPGGRLWNVLRQDQSPERFATGDAERAVAVRIEPDGSSLDHDPDRGYLTFPGANTKFTVGFDPVIGCYLALVNPQERRSDYRSRLVLSASRDLRQWRIVSELLHHPDPVKHAFQYVDWVFDGEDIVYLSRTAYDDGLGGAHRAHDANYTTFHRIPQFRSLLRVPGSE